MELPVTYQKLHPTHKTLRKALSALWMNADLTILTADKDNVLLLLTPLATIRSLVPSWRSQPEEGWSRTP